MTAGGGAWRQQAIAAAQAGDRAGAQQALAQALAADPQDAESWFWYAAVQADSWQALAALERAVALDPHHARARQGLSAVRADLHLPPAPPPTTPLAPDPPAPPALLAPAPLPTYTPLADFRPSAGPSYTAPPRTTPYIGALLPNGLDPVWTTPTLEGGLEVAASILGLLFRGWRIMWLVRLGIALLVLLGVGGGFLLRGRPASPDYGAAADFQATDVYSGRPVSLAALHGRPVWLNFWASWSPRARDEMAAMNVRWSRWQTSDRAIVGVDSSENAATVRQFLSQHGYRWTFLVDSGSTARLYRVSSLPQDVFIDRRGAVQATSSGGRSAPEMDAALAQILAK